jgi:hypothetical protein
MKIIVVKIAVALALFTTTALWMATLEGRDNETALPPGQIECRHNASGDPFCD